jgi:tRNA threonylcarbamoyladenosine biosynthesis protein TsaE
MAELILPDEAATARLGQAIAGFIKPADVITLSGELGSGKTTLVRHILRALGVTGRVRSPSFALMESYDCAHFQVCHFDFYRFERGADWRDAGFDDLIGAKDTVCLIEWPEMAQDSLPQAVLALKLAMAPLEGERLRLLHIEAGCTRASDWIAGLAQAIGLTTPS